MAAMQLDTGKEEKKQKKAADPVDTYSKVSAALNIVSGHGVKLGAIPNSQQPDDGEDDEDEVRVAEYSRGEEKKKTAVDLLPSKAHHLLSALTRCMKPSSDLVYGVSTTWKLKTVETERSRNYWESSYSSKFVPKPAPTMMFTVNEKTLPDRPEDLLKLCTPSGFGDLKSNSTKVDESVRKAHELKEGIALTKDGEEKIQQFLRFASNKLYNGRKLKAVINKLNMYGPGGFFSEHRDTPKPDVIGSLVVTLPYAFTGGQLVVRSPYENPHSKVCRELYNDNHDAWHFADNLVEFEVCYSCKVTGIVNVGDVECNHEDQIYENSYRAGSDSFMCEACKFEVEKVDHDEKKKPRYDARASLARLAPIVLAFKEFQSERPAAAAAAALRAEVEKQEKEVGEKWRATSAGSLEDWERPSGRNDFYGGHEEARAFGERLLKLEDKEDAAVTAINNIGRPECLHEKQVSHDGTIVTCKDCGHCVSLAKPRTAAHKACADGRITELVFKRPEFKLNLFQFHDRDTLLSDLAKIQARAVREETKKKLHEAEAKAKLEADAEEKKKDRREKFTVFNGHVGQPNYIKERYVGGKKFIEECEKRNTCSSYWYNTDNEDYGAAVEKFPQINTVEAVAFYGNCPHEVLPVKRGIRATVSFYLKYDGEDQYYDPLDLGYANVDTDADRVHKHEEVPEKDVVNLMNQRTDVVELVKDYFDVTKAGHLGILCANRYSASEIDGGVLKGCDGEQMLRKLREDKRFECKLVPVVVREHFEGHYAGSGIPKLVNYDVFRFTENDIERLAGNTTVSVEHQIKTDGKTAFIGSTWKTLTTSGDPWVDHTGNESQARSRDNHYYSVAVLVSPAAEGEDTEEEEEKKEKKQKKRKGKGKKAASKKKVKS